MDEDGKLRFQVQRFEDPKGFRQRRPDPDRPGEWIYNLDGVEPLLYRLDQLAVATGNDLIFVVEGEKDVDRLSSLGEIATTNPGEGRENGVTNTATSSRTKSSSSSPTTTRQAESTPRTLHARSRCMPTW